MPVPTFDQLLRPILELSTQQDVTRGVASQAMVQHFNLTKEDQEEMVPSGTSTKIRNRTGWAFSNLYKGGLITKVAKYTYRATPKGRDYLAKHSGPITVKDLYAIEGWQAAWDEAAKRRALAKADMGSEDVPEEANVTPDEQLDKTMAVIDESLRRELLEQLAGIDPYRFEHVVIDLLFAMGYGGSKKEAARVTQKSNDEGIDGVINEDRLGLNTVYVQAKRWKNTVGRQDIQSFVGALAGQQATKGVFITTSTFATTAIEYAQKVSQKVILIDGARLADLMIEHNVGVSTVRTFAIKRVDSDYFEEA